MQVAVMLFLGFALLYVVASGKAKAVFQAMAGGPTTAQQPTAQPNPQG